MSRQGSFVPSSLVAVLCVGLLLAALPALGASEDTFRAGEIIGPSSADVAVELQTLSGATLCYIDDDGDSSYDALEPVILKTTGSCSTRSKGNDLRMTNWNGLTPGERLKNAQDSNKDLKTPPNSPDIWYFDADGNNRLNVGDTVYLNLVNANLGFVDVGDVRISPFEDFAAGTVAIGGDRDIGTNLRLLGDVSQVLGHVDVQDDSKFDDQDLLYLNADKGGNELVEYGDLRLTGINGERPFGSFVEFGDGDGASLYTKITRPVCFNDADGSGGYGTGDVLYLDLDASCAGSTARGDIRLTASANHAAGTRVATGDSDLGAGLEKLTANLAYLDANGDQSFDMEETMFIDIMSTSANRIDTGDVRLSPIGGPGGTIMLTGAPEVGQTVRRLGTFEAHTAFISIAGGDKPDPTDPVYINVDGGGSSEGVEAGDVRLVPVRDLPFGGAAEIGSGEVLPTLTSTSANVCAVFSQQSTYASGDAVYLSLEDSCSSIDTDDIRLTPVGKHLGGTVVRSTDSDHGGDTDSITGSPKFKFFDADGNGEWSAADTLYLDLASTSDNKINVGDLRLTSFGQLGPMTTVVSGDSDVSAALVEMGTASSRVDFVDGDNNGKFSAGDIAYVNADDSGLYVSILDVRLVKLKEPMVLADDATPDEEPPAETPDDDADAEAPATPDTPETPSDGGSMETPDGGGMDGDSMTPEDPEQAGPSDEDGVRTPSVGVVAVLLSLALMALLARRRDAP